jgi:hypothetical protein
MNITWGFRLTSRRLRALLAAGAACAACAVPAVGASAARAANLAPPVRAVFLKEFSRPEYTMVKGQLLIFENDDPFLQHGLGGSITALIADPGKTRLVRNSPYFSPGTYGFFDPLHPEMRATLTVTAGTSPPPDTVPPTAKIKVLPVAPAKFAATGRVRVRVTPSEAADVDLSVVLGKKKLASSSAAYADPVSRVVLIEVPPPARKLVAAQHRVSVQGRVVDVTGKAAKLHARRNLAGGKKRKK